MSKSLHRLALAAFITVAGVAHAAPFTGQGIPSDPAAGILHIDAEAARNSTLYGAFKQIGEAITAKKPDQKAAADKMNAELGWTSTSTRDATLLVYAPKPGDKMPGFVGVARGKFDRAKLLALPATHPEVVAHKLGSHTWFTISDLQKTYGASPKNSTKGFTFECCLAPVNDDAMVVASSPELLARGLAAYDAKATYNDASGTTALTASKGAVISAYLPESFFTGMAPAGTTKPAESELKSLAFTLAEAAGNLQLHADAHTDSDKAAQQYRAQGSMYLAMAPMLLGQEKPGESAADKADKAFFLSAVQALKLGSSGDTLTVDFSYPAGKIADKLREKQGDIVSAIEKQGHTGSAVKSSARKPATPAPVATE